MIPVKMTRRKTSSMPKHVTIWLKESSIIIALAKASVRTNCVGLKVSNPNIICSFFGSKIMLVGVSANFPLVEYLNISQNCLLAVFIVQCSISFPHLNRNTGVLCVFLVSFLFYCRAATVFLFYACGCEKAWKRLNNSRRSVVL